MLLITLHSTWARANLKGYHSHSNKKNMDNQQNLDLFRTQQVLKSHLRSKEKQVPPQKNGTQAPTQCIG